MGRRCLLKIIKKKWEVRKPIWLFELSVSFTTSFSIWLSVSFPTASCPRALCAAKGARRCGAATCRALPRDGVARRCR